MTPPRRRAAAALVGSLALAAVLLSAPAVARGERMEFRLDAERSEVRIRLGATLHTVRGSAPIEPAVLTWDTETGDASGRVLVHANLLDTGIDARNHKMQDAVLKSAEHPEIVFEATRFELRQPGEDEMRFVLEGTLMLLGEPHQITLETHARRRQANSWKARADVNVPYVEWGLEDPSIPLFSVDKHVSVQIKAIGTLTRE